MNNKNKKENLSKDMMTNELSEITLMSKIIIKKYSIPDLKLALSIASELYNNGIGIDKFSEKYYSAPFYLDEIIHYLIRKKKIYSFSRQVSKTKNTDIEQPMIPSTKADIIKFQPKKKNLKKSPQKGIYKINSV